MNHGRIHHPNDPSGAMASDSQKRSLRSRHGQLQRAERSTGQCAVNATRDVLTVRLSRNGVDEALLGRRQNHSLGKLKVHPICDKNVKASSSGTDSKSNESESDEEIEDQGNSLTSRNHPASSYTSGSTGKNDASEGEDDDDDDTEDDTDGSDTETYSNRSGPSNKRLRSSASKTETQNTAKVRRMKSDSPKVRAGYRTRNQGRRTIQYTEQDDEEDEAGDKNALGISSRGRPQRPNVRLASMIRH